MTNRTLARLSRQVAPTSKVVDSAAMWTGQGIDPTPEEYEIIKAHNRWSNLVFETRAIASGSVALGASSRRGPAPVFNLSQFEVNAEQKRLYGSTVGKGDDSTVLTLSYLAGDQAVIKKVKLLLSAVSEQASERVDPAHTFGNPIVFTASGEQPKIFVYQATALVNKKDGDSRTEFMELYKKTLKGSSRIKGGSSVTLLYSNKTVTGDLISLDMSDSAFTPGAVQLSFSIFVHSDVVTQNATIPYLSALSFSQEPQEQPFNVVTDLPPEPTFQRSIEDSLTILGPAADEFDPDA